MPIYQCNHCGKKVKNNAGSAQEIGMITLNYIGTGRKKSSVDYCFECAKEITEALLNEI